MNAVTSLNRTLEQELLAVLRGASYECFCCGEFLLHRRGEICCPECGLRLERDERAGQAPLECDAQAG